MATPLHRHIQDLQSRGRYHFTTGEAVAATSGSLTAARAALRRLKAKGEIADPYRGFHVIVPPEYRRLGCLPAEEFVPQLMAHLDEPYYVALLSAAAYHGASHQKPQVFQVMVPRRRRAIECGEVHVQFVSRRDMAETPIVERNTARGVIRIASAPATALELVAYSEHAGGLDNVATVLSELAENIEPGALVSEAERGAVAWVQRLGHLLVLVGATELADALEPVVVARDPYPVALDPSLPTAGCPGDRRWRLTINDDVEPDL